MIYVIKKDGTREEFDPQKIVKAVNKSAARILYTFSQEEKDFICRFAQEHADSLGKNEIEIQEMHNIVEGALERVNPGTRPAPAQLWVKLARWKMIFLILGLETKVPIPCFFSRYPSSTRSASALRTVTRLTS